MFLATTWKNPLLVLPWKKSAQHPCAYTCRYLSVRLLWRVTPKQSKQDLCFEVKNAFDTTSGALKQCILKPELPPNNISPSSK